MTDTAPAETAEVAPATEKPAKQPKVKIEPHPCYCQSFQLVGEDKEETFTTGCEATTMRQFAQGHDARLVSFLVSGWADGYKLEHIDGDNHTAAFAQPQDAPGLSEALTEKTRRAVEHHQAEQAKKTAKAAERETQRAAKQAEREQAKAEKAAKAEAAKAEKAASQAAAPREVPVQVASTPAPEGLTKVKVGRWEYDAVIDEDGVAEFIDGKGETQRVDRDGYRVLSAV